MTARKKSKLELELEWQLCLSVECHGQRGHRSRKFKHGVRTRMLPSSVEKAEKNLTKRHFKPLDSSNISLTELFSAVSSLHRLRLIQALFFHPASAAKLGKAIGLTGGPLYFHIKGLQLTGIVVKRSRDTYQLTELGLKLAAILPLLAKMLSANSHFSSSWFQS